jgi:hypothetical protein
MSAIDLVEIDDSDDDVDGEGGSSSTANLGGRKLGLAWNQAFGKQVSNKNTLNMIKESRGTECDSCRKLIKHGKKIEIVAYHLKNCRHYLNSLRPAELRDDLGPSHQTSLKEFTRVVGIPALSQVEQDKFQQNFARFFYVSGTSFHRARNKHLLEALKCLRPDVQVPTRTQLADELLNKEYNSKKRKIAHHFQQNKATAYAVISTDGSEDVHRNSITSYNLISDGKSIFERLVSDGGIAHTGENIAKAVVEVMNDTFLPFDSLIGAVMDNTSANKASWKILRKQFRSKFFMGCKVHAIDLLLESILDPKQSKFVFSDFHSNPPY